MTEKRVDTAALLARVDIVQLIDGYVPLTKSGAEFEACCPFHTESSPSFKVSPSKQFYHCFGCGAHGDAIKFLEMHQGLSFVDACKVLGADVGGAPAADAKPRDVRAAPEKKGSDWLPIVPAPANVPDIPRAHIKRGFPESIWCYRDATCAEIGYVYRFAKSTGGKEVLPHVWARNVVTGAEEWHWMAFPEPRPIYGLDRLAERPDAVVLLVEGEKCADAAFLYLNDLVVISWPGGGKAVKKVDWSPLAGRKVILWPDCDAKRVPLTAAERESGIEQSSKPLLPEADQPGVMAMAAIEDILRGLGCTLWRMSIPAPGEKPDGWDVADAVADGLVGDALADFIRAHIQPLAAATVGVEAVSEPIPEVLSTPSQASARDGSWRSALLRRDDKLIDCRENVYLMLLRHPMWEGVLWADEFARKIVKRKPAPWESSSGFVPGAEWGEDDDLRLGLWLAQQERLLVRSTENLSSAVGWVARETRWHPVRDYLDGLEWDGVSRIEDWLTDYLGVKRTEYTRLSGKLFLIGMAARIYKPGCPMRAMPILEGTQYRGKSTALRILGGKWFSDTPIDLNNKDSYQLIQGRWLYEIAELDAFNRAEATRIKAFVSSQEDRFRAPYDRAPKDWPRHTVFFGTTNQDEYFKDQTGNTRYWPLRVEEVDHINLDGLAGCRDQLFAEAVSLFRSGERWHPSREEQLKLFEPEQSAREISDPWQTLISKWLKASTAAHVSATEILTDCLKIEAAKIDSARQMSTRVGIAMKRLGWVKKRQTSGDREYYYVRPAIEASGNEGGDHAPF